MSRTRYKFCIDMFTPATLPMERLAEYMAALAKMLGNTEGVHFDTVTEGSAVLEHYVDAEALPGVEERLAMVQSGKENSEPFKAYKEINLLLEKDNAVGIFQKAAGAEMISFPGRESIKPRIYKGIKQAGSLKGMLMRIGGRKHDVTYATLVDGETSYHCEIPWPVAREMAKHLAAEALCVHGKGRWDRTEGGKWELKSFRVQSFDILEDTPLTELVETLQSIPGNEWFDMEDPHQALSDLRNGNEAFH